MIPLAVVMKFLRHPLGQLACAVLIFGGLALWYGAEQKAEGVKAERARWEARLEADARKARATEAKNAKAAQGASERVEKARELVRWRTKTIVEQIPYAVPTDPSRGNLSLGFVRLHDEAAAGVSNPSDSPSEPDGAASTVGDADALKVIVENYGACRFDQGRLAELQGLVRSWGLAP